MKKQQLWPVFYLLLLSTMRLSAQDPVSIPFFSILDPGYLASLYEQGDGNYSTALFGGNLSNGNIVGEAKMPDADSLLCTPDGTDFSGKIALIDRGGCQFRLKAYNAELGGAIAVVIVNFEDAVVNMGSGDTSVPEPTIPLIMITKSIGDAIKAAIAEGQTVTLGLSNEPLNFGLIQGYVRHDADDNCIAGAGEPPLAGWLVGAQGASGEVTLRTADPAGYYRIFVDTSDSPYTVFAIPPNQAWAPCPASVTVSMNAPDTVQADFAAQANFDCIELSSEISTPFLRRCFDNVFQVNVCNNGTMTAEDAYVDVTMDPEFDPITDASLPFTILSADLYRFDLGDMPAGECTAFSCHAVVNCDQAELGQTLCYAVHAYPDTTCILPSAGWSGASVSVTGFCEGDSVRFVLKNIGGGDMELPQQYVIIEDDVMREEGEFQLEAGQSEEFKVSASGATWRLEANQEPQHPFPGIPAATVEACTDNGSFSTGFYLMYQFYDEGYATDEECQEVIGAYDPNDKQGFPRGFGPDFLIRPNTELEYLIRFQNTGTDTAFTVVVRDTLPAALDASSIRPGPASHPYTLSISAEKVLTFRFDNIRLVDTFTNKAASEGFVSFKIDQMPDNPFGTIIQNSAAIYFDFNPPVITNFTWHEVGYVVGLTTKANEPDGTSVKTVVFPNPLAKGAALRVDADEFANSEWRLFDLNGRQLSSGRMEGNLCRLPQSGLPEGMLTLELQSGTGRRLAVKLVLR